MSLARRRTIIAAFCLLLFGSPSIMAQDQPATPVGDIAQALADEQAQIAALKAELDRQSATIAELTRRLESLTPAVTNAQGGTPPLAPEISPETSLTDFARRFQFYGDT